MANFEFKPLKTGLGIITIYVGGTTSTTVLDANLVSIGNLEYDYTSLEDFQLGNISLTFSDYKDDIRTNINSIFNQAWIIDVDGTKYFEGIPLESSISFKDNLTDAGDAVGSFGLTLGANLFDTSGSYTGLTSYDTNYYSLSDVIDQTIKNNTQITTISYLSTFSYSANGETVYLEKADAGASDAFIVVLKTAVNENTNMNGILNYMGIKLAIWKNTCYAWMKNYTGDTQTITEANTLKTISYTPYQKLDDFFLTSTLNLNNGYELYDYVFNTVTSKSTKIDRGYSFSDAASSIVDGSDRFPIWSAHALGNWVDSSTNNDIVAGSMPSSTENIYTSENWTVFVIFDPLEASIITLADTDFLNTFTAGANLKITFDAMIAAGDPFHDLAAEYNLSFQFGSSAKIVNSVANGKDTLDNSAIPTSRIEIDYDISDDGDLVVGFETTDTGFTTTVVSGVTIKWDGAQTLLIKTLITNELSIGDYVRVTNATQSAFNDVYKVLSFPTANNAELSKDPYTADTVSYSADFVYNPLLISLCNLNIGIASNEDKQIEVFDKGTSNDITPYPFSYEKGGSAVEDEDYNVELRNDVLGDASVANTNIYSVGTSSKKLVFQVDDSTINPYSTITFAEYSVTDGYIQKFIFDFNTGLTTLTVIK